MSRSRVTLRPVAVLVVLTLFATNADAADPPITAAAFSADGGFVVLGSQQGVVVRRWPDLTVVRSIETELSHVNHLAFSPDGKRLVAAGGAPREGGEIELHEWTSGDKPVSRRIHDDLTNQAAWSPNGKRIATAGADNQVHLLDELGVRAATLSGHSRGVLSVVWLPDNQKLVSAGLDQSLRLWDAESGELVRTLDNHTAEVRDLAVRPGGESPIPMVASASADGTVRLWQPTIGRLVRFARLPEEPLDIDWTPDGSRLLASCIDGHLRVIDPDTVGVVHDLPVLDGWAYTVAASPDGRQALVAGSRGQVKAVPLPESK